MSRTGKRTFRDITAVVIFCSVFFGAIVLINLSQAGTESQETADFSEQRISADAAIEQKDYDTAAQNFQAMLARDPFDGRAIFMLARIRYRVFREIENEIFELKSNNDLPATEVNSKIDSLMQDRQEVVELGIADFEKAAAHVRFFEDSSYYLSILHTANKEYDVAIDYLEKFVNAGRFHQRGLNNLETFRPLHSHPNFARIIERENVTRGQQLQQFAESWEFAVPAFSPRGIKNNTEQKQYSSRAKQPRVDSLLASANDDQRLLMAKYRSWFGYNMIRLGRKLIKLVGEIFK